ncbi:MAG: hypothetical protein F6K65_36795 [Moorea sp. SIO3C2]|nr:hypothetical protein [Moorena sp. SIO3C2]
MVETILREPLLLAVSETHPLASQGIIKMIENAIAFLDPSVRHNVIALCLSLLNPTKVRSHTLVHVLAI